MRRPGDDAGAATVELVALTLVLILPLLYLVVAVTRVQAGAYAAEAGASAAARAAVTTGLARLDAGHGEADAAAAARDAAVAAATLSSQDFGLAAAPMVELDCAGECLAPGTTVTARVALAVPLPGVPAAVRAVLPAEVSVEAIASSPVDGYAP